MDIEHLLNSTENEHIERKTAETKFNFESLMEYISAFANEKGGYLILGQRNDKSIVGTTAFLNKHEELKLRILNGSLSHKLRVDVKEFVKENKRILIFKIPSRPIGEPVSYNGAYYMRCGESLVKLDPTTLKKIYQEIEEDFSSKICENANLDDLDSEVIEKLKILWIKKSGNEEIAKLSNYQMLTDLGLIENQKITYAALILVGRKESIDKNIRLAEVIWEFRSNPSSVEYQARDDFRKAFLMYYDDLWEKINSRNELHHIQQGLLITDIKSFNEQVMREAILNAIAHRDYRIDGSIFIKQDPSKIEIINPGGFLPGITPINIVNAPSKPRNRLVLEVLQKIGFVEKSGQGVDKIFRETIKEGKGIPDYSKSDDYNVTLIIDAIVKDKEFVKYLEQASKETSVMLSVEDLIVLEKIKSGEKLNSAFKELSKLSDNNFIEKVGRKYILSKKYYESIDKRGEYTRRKGLDKNANKMLILFHLQNHKKGYMHDLEDALKNVPKPTINKYLNELKKEGRIELIGKPSANKGPNRAYWKLKEDN